MRRWDGRIIWGSPRRGGQIQAGLLRVGLVQVGEDFPGLVAGLRRQADRIRHAGEAAPVKIMYAGRGGDVARGHAPSSRKFQVERPLEVGQLFTIPTNFQSIAPVRFKSDVARRRTPSKDCPLINMAGSGLPRTSRQ